MVPTRNYLAATVLNAKNHAGTRLRERRRAILIGWNGVLPRVRVARTMRPEPARPFLVPLKKEDGRFHCKRCERKRIAIGIIKNPWLDRLGQSSAIRPFNLFSSPGCASILHRRSSNSKQSRRSSKVRPSYARRVGGVSPSAVSPPPRPQKHPSSYLPFLEVRGDRVLDRPCFGAPSFLRSERLSAERPDQRDGGKRRKRPGHVNAATKGC